MEHGHQFPSETVKIKCQFCEKEIMRRNYKPHTRNVHPKKDLDDLPPFGHSKLTCFFTQAGPAMVVEGKVSSESKKVKKDNTGKVFRS